MPCLALAIAGCSGGFGSSSLPSLPSLPVLPANAPEFPGSSTAVYTRIARGANTCWFGPRGTLDRTYIWHARAEPESKGGIAEILIHERVDKNQRGLKAFSVTIAPRGEGAAVAVDSLKMPLDKGRQMTADAYRWAKGNVGCTDGDTDWAPVSAANTPPPNPKKQKKLAVKRPAPKAATTPATPAATGSTQPGGGQAASASRAPLPASPKAP